MSNVVDFLVERGENLHAPFVAKIVNDLVKVNPISGSLLESSVAVLDSRDLDHPLYVSSVEMVLELLPCIKETQSILIQDQIDGGREVTINSNGEMVMELGGYGIVL